MALKEVKVRISDLEIGMYISRLDRPWLETPYLIQGFELKTQDDIDELLKYCKYAYVDVELSNVKEDEASLIRVKSQSSDEQKEYLTKVKPRKYKVRAKFDDELKTAQESHAILTDAAEGIMVDISNNKNLHLPSLKKAITPMVDSVVRNPDAFSWLTRMKVKGNYIYNHSVSSSVWCVAFGRHLGLPKKDLQSLAIGGLLLDVGKTRLPDKLINNTERYNQYEFKLVKQHVEHSVDIVSSINGITDDVVEMVRTHHERHNGSGYPASLKGNMIPIFGKIAGIVDCYDAITSERPFSPAISPHEAVKKLYEWRDVDFQAELVEQFIQIVGIYPVGSVIELTDGRVGIIVAQHKVWRLRPKVMLLLDENKKTLQSFDIIDMYHVVKDKKGNPLDIVRSVEASTYGIDPEQFYL